jgi:hypothetical protein
VNQLVLSGTDIVVPSGTGSSCYRGPESVLSVCNQARSSRRNFTNQKSFGFLLTDRAVFQAVHNPGRQLLSQPVATDLRPDGEAA